MTDTTADHAFQRIREQRAGSHTLETLAGARRVTLDATRTWLAAQTQARRILILGEQPWTNDDNLRIPRFQFDHRHNLHPDIGPVIATLTASGYDPEDQWTWFHTPHPYTGRNPADMFVDGDHSAVTRLANHDTRPGRTT